MLAFIVLAACKQKPVKQTMAVHPTMTFIKTPISFDGDACEGMPIIDSIGIDDFILASGDRMIGRQDSDVNIWADGTYKYENGKIIPCEGNGCWPPVNTLRVDDVSLLPIEDTINKVFKDTSGTRLQQSLQLAFEKNIHTSVMMIATGSTDSVAIDVSTLDSLNRYKVTINPKLIKWTSDTTFFIQMKP